MPKQLKDKTYPNIPPEPSMYLPRVRMTPLGPAPYWKIVTLPSQCKHTNKVFGSY